MATDENRRITELDTLKALAHPLRLTLYRALYQARTATASQLADQVDEAVSLVSYHLRKLAAHGVIEEAEQQSSDGRERWWQVVLSSYSVSHKDFRDAPEQAAAYSAFTRMAFREHVELYERYLDEQSAWEEAWRSGAFNSRSLARLTADELRQAGEELGVVLKKWKAHADAAPDAEGRENVVLHLFGFPTRP